MISSVKQLYAWTFDKIQIVSRLFRLIWDDNRTSILISAILSVLLVVLPLGSSACQALLVNLLIAHDEHQFRARLIGLLSACVGASIAISILSTYRTFVSKTLYTRVGESLELIMMRKRSELEVATYEDPQFHDLLSKLDERGIWPAWSLIQEQFQTLANITQLVLSVGILTLFDWRLCVLSLLSVLPEFIIELQYGKTSWDIWDKDTQARRRYQMLRGEFTSLHGLIELSVFQNISLFLSRATDMLRSFTRKRLHLDRRSFKRRLMATVISVALQSMIFGWIVYLTAIGQIKIGTMTFLLASASRFQGSLNGLFNGFARQVEAALYAESILRVIDIAPALPLVSSADEATLTSAPRIEFRDVSFSYPGASQHILKNINLIIEPGEKLAIVGLNGAGKSTLIKLLMRFYDPTHGVILVNDRDLREMSRTAWWSSVAALFQHYANYKFTVRENISLGRSDVDPLPEAVVEAARRVDAHEFIMKLEGQYDQMIGKEFEGGTDLSWGQLQKVALSRTLFRKGRVLILDEPTASIDAKAEATFFEELRRDAWSQTQIIISHRFSTIRSADRICVLNEGGISELGSHDQLMKMGKEYARLYLVQASAYK